MENLLIIKYISFSLLVKILFINLIPCHGDYILRKLQSSHKIIPPKVWMAYIHKFLDSIFQSETSSSACHNSSVKHYSTILYKKSKYLILLREKEIVRNVMFMKKLDMYFTHEETYSVTKPTGHILFAITTMHREEHMIIFSIERQLSMNLTFLEFYFANSNLFCEDQKATFLNYRSYPFLTHLVLCGHHAIFNVYSEDNSFSVMLTTKVNLEIRISGKYCIIDKGMVYNTPVRPKGLVYSYIVNFVHGYNATNILIYHLKVLKISRIKLGFVYLDESNCTVYDGPGLLSPQKKVKSHTLILSTFQCFVQVILIYFSYVRKFSFTNSVDNKLSVHNNLKLMNTSKNNMLLPDDKCDSNRCIFRIESILKLQIKLDILSFSSSKTYDNQLCAFGGLLLGEVNNSKLTQIMLDCSPIVLNRTVYTQLSSAFIVLYWYKEYTNVSTSLDVSTAKCRFITVDPCYLKVYCSFGFSVKACLTHIDYLSLLHYNRHDDYFAIYPNSDQCTVVQFASWYQNRIPPRYLMFGCDLKLIIKNDHMGITDIQMFLHEGHSFAIQEIGHLSKRNFLHLSNSNVQKGLMLHVYSANSKNFTAGTLTMETFSKEIHVMFKLMSNSFLDAIIKQVPNTPQITFSIPVSFQDILNKSYINLIFIPKFYLVYTLNVMYRIGIVNSPLNNFHLYILLKNTIHMLETNLLRMREARKIMLEYKNYNSKKTEWWSRVLQPTSKYSKV